MVRHTYIVLGVLAAVAVLLIIANVCLPLRLHSGCVKYTCDYVSEKFIECYTIYANGVATNCFVCGNVTNGTTCYTFDGGKIGLGSCPKSPTCNNFNVQMALILIDVLVGASAVVLVIYVFMYLCQPPPPPQPDEERLLGYGTNKKEPNVVSAAEEPAAEESPAAEEERITIN